jgi:two-component system NarL family sensor kinase
MAPDARRRELLLPRGLAALALVVPLLLTDYILLQWQTAVPEFLFVWHDEGEEPSIIQHVLAGGQAEAAGLRPGDIVVSEDGAPFPPGRMLRVGQVVTLGIERDGRLLEFDVQLVPMIQLRATQMATVTLLALVIWSGSVVVLWRRFRQAEVRRLFLLAQSAALLALYPPPELTAWCRGLPWLQHFVTGAAVLLFPTFLLHFHLTFPVLLGAPCQRRLALIWIYGLGVTASGAWVAMEAGLLPYGGLVWRGLGLLLAAELLAAVVLLVYVYLRRATPDGRRRLRLIVFGTALAAGSFALLHTLPAVLTATPWIPGWLAALFLLPAPLSYFYATVRHNLFAIDRLLNRTLVYGLLSLSVLLVYLGLLLLLSRLAPGDPLLQAPALAILTLLVGLTLQWTQHRVQRWVDRLFYGGWYDYPGVVETVCDALSRSLAHDQFEDVLTRQVPRLMQLHPASLHVGQPPEAHPEEALPALRFPLAFQGHVHTTWVVGPRLDREDFAASDRRILQTVAHQAEIALSNVLLVETLHAQVDEIRLARHHLLRSREEERARLGRDLHDGPIQSLVGLSLQLGLLAATQIPEGVAGEIAAMRAEVRHLLAELRQVCAELRPPMLDTVGLATALRAMAEEWSSHSGVAIELDLLSDADLRFLPDEVAVNLYHVVHEALANAGRHANARRVAIRLVGTNEHLALAIRDDGQGFVAPENVQNLVARGHFGLAGIQERVQIIGGTWQIVSAPGQGTEIHITWQASQESTGESANPLLSEKAVAAQL